MNDNQYKSPQTVVGQRRQGPIPFPMFVLACANTLFVLGLAYAALTEFYGLSFDAGSAYLHLPDHQYTTPDGDPVIVYDSMIFVDPIGVAVLVGGFATVVNLASLAFLMAMRSMLRPRRVSRICP